MMGKELESKPSDSWHYILLIYSFSSFSYSLLFSHSYALSPFSQPVHVNK